MRYMYTRHNCLRPVLWLWGTDDQTWPLTPVQTPFMQRRSKYSGGGGGLWQTGAMATALSLVVVVTRY